jgi:hypothetical protein
MPIGATPLQDELRILGRALSDRNSCFPLLWYDHPGANPLLSFSLCNNRVSSILVEGVKGPTYIAGGRRWAQPCNLKHGM